MNQINQIDHKLNDDLYVDYTHEIISMYEKEFHSFPIILQEFLDQVGYSCHTMIDPVDYLNDIGIEINKKNLLSEKFLNDIKKMLNKKDETTNKNNDEISDINSYETLNKIMNSEFPPDTALCANSKYFSNLLNKSSFYIKQNLSNEIFAKAIDYLNRLRDFESINKKEQ